MFAGWGADGAPLQIQRSYVSFGSSQMCVGEKGSGRLSNFVYLSKGAFALVYRALLSCENGLQVLVAVKVLKPANHQSVKHRQRFLQEAAVHTALKHRHIVECMGTCTVPLYILLPVTPMGLLHAADGPYHECWAVVMELVTDGNLYDRILLSGQSLPQYPLSQALTWLMQLADAMRYMHSLTPFFIHRDLKLENVLLTRDACSGSLCVKLCDFGLVVGIDSQGKKMEAPTILEPPYMAASPSGPAIDVAEATGAGDEGYSAHQNYPGVDSNRGSGGTDTAAFNFDHRKASEIGQLRRVSQSWSGTDRCTNSFTSTSAVSPGASPGAMLEDLGEEEGPSLLAPRSNTTQKESASVQGVPGKGSQQQTRERKAGMAVHAELLQKHNSFTPDIKANSGLLHNQVRRMVAHKDDLPDLIQAEYRLTARCGSILYMAPEVARDKPYNEKADVFSFGMIGFEMLSRTLISSSLPLNDVDAAMEHMLKVAWKGWRPTIPAYLPAPLQALLGLCWHAESKMRPCFATIYSRLMDAECSKTGIALDNAERASIQLSRPLALNQNLNQNQNPAGMYLPPGSKAGKNSLAAGQQGGTVKKMTSSSSSQPNFNPLRAFPGLLGGLAGMAGIKISENTSNSAAAQSTTNAAAADSSGASSRSDSGTQGAAYRMQPTGGLVLVGMQQPGGLAPSGMQQSGGYIPGGLAAMGGTGGGLAPAGLAAGGGASPVRTMDLMAAANALNRRLAPGSPANTLVSKTQVGAANLAAGRGMTHGLASPSSVPVLLKDPAAPQRQVSTSENGKGGKSQVAAGWDRSSKEDERSRKVQQLARLQALLAERLAAGVDKGVLAQVVSEAAGMTAPEPASDLPHTEAS